MSSVTRPTGYRQITKPSLVSWTHYSAYMQARLRTIMWPTYSQWLSSKISTLLFGKQWENGSRSEFLKWKFRASYHVTGLSEVGGLSPPASGLRKVKQQRSLNPAKIDREETTEVDLRLDLRLVHISFWIRWIFLICMDPIVVLQWCSFTAASKRLLREPLTAHVRLLRLIFHLDYLFLFLALQNVARGVSTYITRVVLAIHGNAQGMPVAPKAFHRARHLIYIL